MKLETQVVSLELAKKLKELGVKQESLFYWFPKFSVWNVDWVVGEEGGRKEPAHCISAFTVAELGEMLPEEYPGESDSNLVMLKFWAGKNRYMYYIRYQNDVLESISHNEMADTEADARAKMLIYLLENNLIEN